MAFERQMEWADAGLLSAQSKNQPMTKEEKQVEAELQRLAAEIRRNERRMRRIFIRYEDLVCENASLIAGIDALMAFREERRRNTFKTLLDCRPIAANNGQSR